MSDDFVSLVIVETPLQLMCGYEADTRALFILRLTGRGSNDEQIINVANLLDINYIEVFIPTEKPVLGLFKNLKVIAGLLRNRFKFVYFGSYFSGVNKLLARVLRFETCSYLDDGVATLMLKDSLAENINIFTFLDVPETNNLKVVRHRFCKLKEVFRCDGVLGEYFIGQPFVDKNMMTSDEYISYIQDAVADSASELLYIPHRVESEGSIERVSQLDGVKILRLNVCIELYFLSKNIMPKKIYSCSSTALLTLSILSPSTDCVAYIGRDPRIKALPHIDDIISSFEAVDSIKIIDHK